MLNKVNFIAHKTRKLCLTAVVFVIFPHVCFAPPPSHDDRRPDTHLCHITLEVMCDPVVASDGQSYERLALEKWLSDPASTNRITGAKKSPATGADLADHNFIPNQALKEIIMNWRPGREGLPSVLEFRPAEDIIRRVRGQFERNAALLHSARDKNIVVIVGGKGAGKSTLVNVLAKKGVSATPDEDAYVLADLSDATAMPIGSSGQSEIRFPKFIDIESEDGPLRLFEFPAFNDIDDSEDNLVNAAFMRHILLDAASVRFVTVAGQDQFTADGGASINKMFHSLRQLFVVEGQEKDLVNEGVFVVTKVTSKEPANLVRFLQSKIAPADEEVLLAQLQSWATQNKFCHMLHPMRQGDLASVREKILSLVKATAPAKIRGINGSVLYPPETVTPLRRMFEHVMQEIFDRRLRTSLTNSPEYDKEITHYGAPGFWARFDTTVCTQDPAMSLMKEFSLNSYTQALVSFERENTQNLQDYIQQLKDEKQKKVAPLEVEYASEAAAAGAVVPHSLSDIVIPAIARGFEDIYRRFLNGTLIYKPDPNSDNRRIDLPIKALANPLEGVFDLSRCGDEENFLSISTGYRKGKKTENANKLEIWLAPRFLIERELALTAAPFQPIMGNWNPTVAPVGVFWTWGGWNNLGYYDYLTTYSLEQLGEENLTDTHHRAATPRCYLPRCTTQVTRAGRFHVSFVN